MASIIDCCVNPISNEGFDIVIGNPPYGAKYDDQTKSYYKKSYVTAKSMSFLRISPLRNVKKHFTWAVEDIIKELQAIEL